MSKRSPHALRLTKKVYRSYAKNKCMHAFVKKMGIVFLDVVVRTQQGRRFWYIRLFSLCREHLSGELLREALLLGPLVVVGGSVLLEDLGVLGDEVLAAVGADGHGLDGSAVLVNLDASAGSVSLLVLAVDTVLLGDRHGEGWWLFVEEVAMWCCVLCLLSCEEDCGRSRKVGRSGFRFRTWRRPFFILLLQNRRKFLVTTKYHSTAERDCQIGKLVSHARNLT
jgi:hypothetical protein